MTKSKIAEFAIKTFFITTHTDTNICFTFRNIKSMVYVILFYLFVLHAQQFKTKVSSLCSEYI